MSSMALLSNYGVNAANDGTTEILINEPTTFYKLRSNEVKYFQVKTSRPDFTGVEDLIVKVQSAEHKGDPDLYISRVSN